MLGLAGLALIQQLDHKYIKGGGHLYSILTSIRKAKSAPTDRPCFAFAKIECCAVTYLTLVLAMHTDRQFWLHISFTGLEKIRSRW